MPRVQRLEERGLRERATHPVVVAAKALPRRAEVLPQRGQVRDRVVARMRRELRGELRRPSRQVGQLVLERAHDHRAEPLPHARLEAAVDQAEQALARRRREVVEAALDGVEQHQPAGTGEAGVAAVERDWLERPAGRQRDRPDRGPARRAVDRQRTLALDDLALKPAPRVLRVALHDLALEVRPREADLVVEPEAHAELLRVAADAFEQRPPRLRHERRVVGVLAVERARGRDVHDHDVEDAAGHEPLELPAQPLGGHALAAPPPQRHGRERARRLGEAVPGILHAHGTYGAHPGFA